MAHGAAAVVIPAQAEIQNRRDVLDSGLPLRGPRNDDRDEGAAFCP
jgi:hypothetical protein